jgi:hypothetical protein
MTGSKRLRAMADAVRALSVPTESRSRTPMFVTLRRDDRCRLK